ncbi:alpha/beta hydrolase [Brachybacterium phenoliresistens]|uniref:Alpha/beta hydrolase n=1 Tax=Brachybacterium phenoliresistens TaxID=396014 RepID=Z9JXQ8_9MICO|nr:alpha/beta hydrolase [Brachybacterium phenoliresistens]EWS82552.1 alpha/beta hydrolase [Brachybacterium phenoliresistens]
MNPLLRSVMRLFAAPRLNMREDYARVRRLQRQLAARPVPRYRAVDLRIDTGDGEREVPVRVFSPREQRREEVLLFLHGGGWVTGDIESYTPACATMADLTGCVVASVDYRLAPEHPFPAGLEDCWRIIRAILEAPWRLGAESAARIVLVGDSAGGNLAAASCLLLHERGLPMPQRQILLYPVTHWDHDPRTTPFLSARRHGADYRLTSTEVEDYLELYVPDPALRRDPLVSPLMASDLDGQPRTLLITAELDLLCDEGEAYGRALRDAGTEVRIHRVEGALHGFITLPRFARSLREAYEVIDEFLDAPLPDGGTP